MEVRLKVSISVKDMYMFLLNNTYRKLSGVVYILFSLVVIGIAIYTWEDVPFSNTLLLVALAALYTVVNPIMLYVRARRQVHKSSQLKNLEYIINSAGIKVAQGDEFCDVTWDEIWKSVKYGSSVIIYVTTIRAFILPMSSLGKQYNSLVDLLNQGIGNRNHIRKSDK